MTREEWIKNRAEQLAQELAREAVKQGLFKKRGFYSAEAQALNFYRKAFTVEGDTGLPLYNSEQPEVQRQAKVEYNELVDNVKIPFEDLPTDISYDDVKSSASALLDGPHDSASFFYNVLLPHDDYHYDMTSQSIYTTDYSNITGDDAAKVSITFIPNEEGDVEWNNDYTTFYYVNRYSGAKKQGIEDQEIFG